MNIKQDEPTKHNSSLQTSQYDCGIRVAPDLTQTELHP
jgi:hypothetical protein